MYVRFCDILYVANDQNIINFVGFFFTIIQLGSAFGITTACHVKRLILKLLILWSTQITTAICVLHHVDA